MAKIKRTWCEKYTLVKSNMGEGGNAIVHIVSDSDGIQYALKELDLSRINAEKKARFSDEIKIMKENSDLSTIMPVYDSSVEEFWYVMPVAEPVIKSFNISNKNEFSHIQDLLISLASALCEIHGRNISHRDIKPDNIYILNGGICYGDFGLVEFPDNPNEFTRSDRGLGSIFTIAPEMKRNPKEADGNKADIYSLAKTIWILLTGETKGFDGQYLINGDYTLRGFEHLRGKHLVELENLLQQATSFEPNARPTSEQFVSELKKWRNVSEDSEKVQISEWSFLNKCLFGEVTPDTVVWSGRDSVIKVLNVMGSLPVYNHMLFSNGGGLDFKEATEANEDACIRIIEDHDLIYILKPKKLYFERFKDPSWNYFLLVMDKLDSILGPDDGFQREMLVEDQPGHYVSAEYVQYGVYDYDTGEKLPDGYNEVCRFIEGALLFVMKNGFYNGINAIYDGRHGMCHPVVFRQYIENFCGITEELSANGLSYEMIMSVLNDRNFSKNPFEEDGIKNDNNNTKKDNNIDKEIRAKYDCEDRSNYIKNNLLEWSFADITSRVKSVKADDCQAIYFIEYQDNVFTLSELASGRKLIYNLSVDGKFRNNEGAEILYFDSVENATRVLNQCKLRLISECEKAGIYDDNYCHYPNISMIKGYIKPSHLFTKDEIRDLMKEADDRKDNTLVINVDGFAQIITGHDDLIYPVVMESWRAGNVYVGKYSNLIDAGPAYIRALNGWVDYLESGRSQYVGYSESENIEKLINKIAMFY